MIVKIAWKSNEDFILTGHRYSRGFNIVSWKVCKHVVLRGSDGKLTSAGKSAFHSRRSNKHWCCNNRTSETLQSQNSQHSLKTQLARLPTHSQQLTHSEAASCECWQQLRPADSQTSAVTTTAALRLTECVSLQAQSQEWSVPLRQDFLHLNVCLLLTPLLVNLSGHC